MYTILATIGATRHQLSTDSIETAYTVGAALSRRYPLTPIELWHGATRECVYMSGDRHYSAAMPSTPLPEADPLDTACLALRIADRATVALDPATARAAGLI